MFGYGGQIKEIWKSIQALNSRLQLLENRICLEELGAIAVAPVTSGKINMHTGFGVFGRPQIYESTPEMKELLKNVNSIPIPPVPVVKKILRNKIKSMAKKKPKK